MILKITISLLFTLKNLLMIIFVFKKHENFFETVEFFLIIWGKWSELEPEPEQEFLTSWSRSRSRTKMDRLRNTTFKHGWDYCLHLPKKSFL
jgi:hypothetical protein